MITIPVTLTATAQSIASLVASSLPSDYDSSLIGDRDDFRMNTIIQASLANSSNVNFGSDSSQSGFIVAGGSISVEKLNLNKTYLVGNGNGVVIHLMD